MFKTRIRVLYTDQFGDSQQLEILGTEAPRHVGMLNCLAQQIAQLGGEIDSIQLVSENTTEIGIEYSAANQSTATAQSQPRHTARRLSLVWNSRALVLAAGLGLAILGAEEGLELLAHA